MTPTDKELLELAAKAAGLDTSHAWNKSRMALNPPILSMVVREGGELVTTGWNPLDNDGDALRVAVNLEIQIDPRQEGNRRIDARHHSWHDGRLFPLLPFYEPAQPDPCAAVRRAIVRAAAEIGRGMV